MVGQIKRFSSRLQPASGTEEFLGKVLIAQ
jgi:hypothetical protein